MPFSLAGATPVGLDKRFATDFTEDTDRSGRLLCSDSILRSPRPQAGEGLGVRGFQGVGSRDDMSRPRSW